MWKKWISLNLVLLLLLSLLPMGAAAAEAGQLKTRWGGNVFKLTIGSSSFDMLYLEDGTAITGADFDLSCDVCPVSWETGKDGSQSYVSLDGSVLTAADAGRTGTLTATRMADGAAFTMSVSVDLPWIGWFSGSDFEAADYLASGFNNLNVNYAEQPELRAVHLLINPKEGAEFGENVQVSGDKEITVTRLSATDLLVELSPTATGAHSVSLTVGIGKEQTRSVSFTDGTGLKTQWDQYSLTINIESDYSGQLYTENDERLSPESFALSSDLGPISWRDGSVYLENQGSIGQSGYIRATRLDESGQPTDQVYSIPVEVTAPWLGWYSAPEISTESFLNGRYPQLIWNYGSKGRPELYLMFNGGRSVASVRVTNDFVKAEIGANDQGQGYVKVTLDDALTDGTVEATISLLDEQGGILGSITGIFTEGRTMFPTSQEMGLQIAGYSSFAFLRLIDGDLNPVTEAEYPKLSITEGMGMVHWDYAYGDNPPLRWHAIDVGAGLHGTITATSADGSKSLSIPVETVLPVYGFYSEPTYSFESYRQPDKYTGTYEGEEGREIYLIVLSSGTDLCAFATAESDNEKIRVDFKEGDTALKISLDAEESGEAAATITFTYRAPVIDRNTGELSYSSWAQYYSVPVSFSAAASLPTVVPGDVTGNGKVEREDVAALFHGVSGGDAALTPEQKEVMDINGDGKINNRDAILLFRRLAGGG